MKDVEQQQAKSSAKVDRSKLSVVLIFAFLSSTAVLSVLLTDNPISDKISNSKSFMEVSNASYVNPNLVDQRINSDIAIAILTTRSLHGRLNAALSSWWNVSRYPDLVTVWSDYPNQTESFHIPNLKNSECESTYHYGLWCKNIPMVNYWRTNPKFKHVKWFVRVMDDSYLHLENLLHLVEQYDHLDPILIGDRFCTEMGFDYPSGGPGIVMSRGFLNTWDTKAWRYPEETNRNHDRYYDDVMWGEYMHHLNPKVHMIHHHGITQNGYRTDSQILRYYMRYTDPALKWPMPFRVVAVHQQKSDISMPRLHEMLHQIHYENVAEITVPIQECTCPGDKHQRCNYDQKLASGPCHYENTLLACISSGPWP